MGYFSRRGVCDLTNQPERYYRQHHRCAPPRLGENHLRIGQFDAGFRSNWLGEAVCPRSPADAEVGHCKLL